MLSLTNLKIMKVLLFAIGFSNILLSISFYLGIFDVSHLSVKTMNLGVIIGGMIFGLGFGVIGFCPGTCMASFGSQKLSKLIPILLGGLFGAFVFSLTYGQFVKLGLFDTMNMGKLTLFSLSDKFPSVFHLGFSGLWITGILLMGAAMLIPEQLRTNKA